MCSKKAQYTRDEANFKVKQKYYLRAPLTVEFSLCQSGVHGLTRGARQYPLQNFFLKKNCRTFSIQMDHTSLCVLSCIHHLVILYCARLHGTMHFLLAGMQGGMEDCYCFFHLKCAMMSLFLFGRHQNRRSTEIENPPLKPRTEKIGRD